MKALYPAILDKSLTTGLNKALAFCTSRQLRKRMRREVLVSTPVQAKGVLNVPQYWAIYKHDGRGIVKTQSANFLVWFPNPKDDPRLVNGESPINRADIKRLNQVISKAEFNRLRKSGKMVVSKLSGAMSKSKANPFFSNEPNGGMAGFEGLFIDISRSETFAHVEQFLQSSGLKNKKIVVNL